MKKFLLLVTTLIFLCGGAVTLSACGENAGGSDNDEGKIVAADYTEYTGDIDYRLSITTEEECPNGEINDNYLYSAINPEQGGIYYIVLDCTCHNFGWAQDNFTISMAISDSNCLIATLQEAKTGKVDERIENSEYIISTQFGVPQDREEEGKYRIVYKIRMTAGYMITADFGIDDLGKCAPLAMGKGLNLELNEEKTAYTVKGLSDKSIQNVVIPARFGEYPITGIAISAFYGNEKIKSIVIGNGIKSVGQSAFGGCENLESVYINDLKAWCNIDFDNFTNPLVYAKKLYVNNNPVTNLEIPQGVTQIKKYAFYGYRGLEGLTIPDEVNSIGKGAFEGCKNIRTATMSAESFDSIPTTNLRTAVVTSAFDIKGIFSDSTNLISVELCDGIKAIDNNAFKNCTSLTDVNIPSGVQYIDGRAFENCTSLGSIILPSGVQYIDDNAFNNCTNLESINIPDSVTSIGHDAFCGCLKLIQTQDGVKYVDKWVVGYDDSNAAVVLRADTKGISQWAFDSCRSLESITIPESLNYIGCSAFYDCDNLNEVIFENTAGWEVSENRDMSNPEPVNVGDFGQNARYLTDYFSYLNYYWGRCDS